MYTLDKKIIYIVFTPFPYNGLVAPFLKVHLDIIKVNLLIYIRLTLTLNQRDSLIHIILLVSKYNITATIIIFREIPILML